VGSPIRSHELPSFRGLDRAGHCARPRAGHISNCVGTPARFRIDSGFVYGREGAIALADYVITSATAFIVFTFGSMIVAIQVASGQSSPRIIATMLLRDNAIRYAVGLFAYVLLLAVAIKTRIDTTPQSLISLMGVLALTSVIVFMFLIDHAARLLRPVTIVTRIARDGLTVIDDVYPDPIAAAPLDSSHHGELGHPERTVAYRGTIRRGHRRQSEGTGGRGKTGRRRHRTGPARWRFRVNRRSVISTTRRRRRHRRPGVAQVRRVRTRAHARAGLHLCVSRHRRHRDQGAVRRDQRSDDRGHRHRHAAAIAADGRHARPAQ
jgi:hypothetical protein